MTSYDKNLDKNEANFVPLSPLTFLERTKDIYPNYESVVYESRKYTWKDTYNRCVKFASALDKIGIKTGDTVSIMAFNTPEIFEAHYSIPMVGAVINAINTRLDPKTISYILNHSDAKVLIVDRQFHEIITKALKDGYGRVKLTALNGQTFVARSKGGKIFLKDQNGDMSEVIATDVVGTNGVIHVIDSVIMPD